MLISHMSLPGGQSANSTLLHARHDLLHAQLSSGLHRHHLPLRCRLFFSFELNGEPISFYPCSSFNPTIILELECATTGYLRVPLLAS